MDGYTGGFSAVDNSVDLDRWDDLNRQQTIPLWNAAWSQAAANHLCGTRIKLLHVRHGERLDGVLPLVKTRMSGLPCLQLPGAVWLYEPFTPAATAEALSELVTTLRHQPYPVLLHRIPTDHPIWQTSHSPTPIGPSSSAWVNTAQPWEDYWQSVSSRRRSDVRRYARKTKGEITLQYESPTENEAGDALARFATMEHQGWKGERGSSLEANPRMYAFFLNLAQTMAQTGELRVFTLCVDDTPIAMQWVLYRARRYWVLKIAYDEAWRSCAPGILLTLRIIEHACGESDVDAYEFLGADEPWIHPWASGERRYANALICPRSPWGLFALGMHTARTLVKQWRHNNRQ